MGWFGRTEEAPSVGLQSTPPSAPTPEQDSDGVEVRPNRRRGACFEENVGWERRIWGKAVAGGVVGVGAATWLAVFRHRPLLRTACATSASVALVASLYGVTQEALRVLTCQDGPVNSLFAGGISGWALGTVHRGPSSVVKGSAALFASAGALCHVMDANGLSIGAFGEWAASAAGLIDRSTASDGSTGSADVVPWYERWLPIRKLDPDEYDNFHAQRELKNAYGTGEIEREEYAARLSELQMEAFFRKQKRMEKGEANRHSPD